MRLWRSVVSHAEGNLKCSLMVTNLECAMKRDVDAVVKSIPTTTSATRNSQLPITSIPSSKVRFMRDLCENYEKMFELICFKFQFSCPNFKKLCCICPI